MRRQRRQDVLHRAVLVDVAGDAERRQLAHLFGGRDRAAEDQNRQPAAVELADRPHQLDAAGMRQPQIEDDQVDPRQVGAHAGEQLGGALDVSAVWPAPSSAVAKRSRTKAVSSATMTVLVVVTVVAVT